nr:hypothetical protein [Alphaproteobacteria bacterium]
SPSLLLQTESQLARSCSQDKTALIATLYPMSYDQAVKDSKVHDDGRAVSFRDIRCDSVLEFISENAITAYYRSTTLSLAAIWYFAHNNPTKKFNLGPLKALADTVLPACKAKPSLYLFPLIQVKMQKYDQP